MDIVWFILRVFELLIRGVFALLKAIGSLLGFTLKYGQKNKEIDLAETRTNVLVDASNRSTAPSAARTMAQASLPAASLEQKLEELKRLQAKGLINEDEHRARRSRLLEI